MNNSKNKKKNESSVIGDLDEAEDVVVRVRLEGGRTRRRERRGAIGGAGQASRRALTKSTSADSVDAVLVAVCGERRWTLAPHFFAIMWISSSSVETHTCGGPSERPRVGRRAAVERAGGGEGGEGSEGCEGGGGGTVRREWRTQRQRRWQRR